MGRKIIRCLAASDYHDLLDPVAHKSEIFNKLGQMPAACCYINVIVLLKGEAAGGYIGLIAAFDRTHQNLYLHKLIQLGERLTAQHRICSDPDLNDLDLAVGEAVPLQK